LRNDSVDLGASITLALKHNSTIVVEHLLIILDHE